MQLSVTGVAKRGLLLHQVANKFVTVVSGSPHSWRSNCEEEDEDSQQEYGKDCYKC